MGSAPQLSVPIHRDDNDMPHLQVKVRKKKGFKQNQQHFSLLNRQDLIK